MGVFSLSLSLSLSLLLFVAACDNTVTNSLGEQEKDAISTVEMIDLENLTVSQENSFLNQINKKGEQADFHPDSLRMWAKQSLVEFKDSEAVQLLGGDLPCEELPGGGEECYDEPPTNPPPP